MPRFSHLPAFALARSARVRSAIPRFAKIRLLAVGFALVLAGALASATPAAATTTANAESPAVEEARRWQGRWCPLTGCGPPPGASAASVGGFAAAALGAVVLARRRRP